MTFFFHARFTFSILTPLFLLSSSVSLSYFILAVPMRECLGKHSCMSSPFPIRESPHFFAKRNGTCFGRSFAYQNLIILLLLLIYLYIEVFNVTYRKEKLISQEESQPNIYKKQSHI